MRDIKTLFRLLILTFFVGCIPSLHPLYTTKDIIFEQSLIGTWIEKNESTAWSFRQGTADKAYDLICTIKRPTGEKSIYLEAHLVKLGKFLFLDLYPKGLNNKAKPCDPYCIPIHTFSRVVINGDVLNVMMINPGVFRRMLERKKIKITHEFVNDEIIVTASTKELQTFAMRHAEDKALFSCIFKFHRQQDDKSAVNIH